jgi:hypothetical protein
MRPGRRRDKAQAILVPITPPPTMRRSHVCAITTSSEQESESPIVTKRSPAEEGDQRPADNTANKARRAGLKDIDTLRNIMEFHHEAQNG